METQMIRVRCFDCGHEWSQASTKEVAVCPNCGSPDLVDPETDGVGNGALEDMRPRWGDGKNDRD